MTPAVVDFDLAAFRGWLEPVVALSDQARVEAMKGGASCEMFRVHDADRSWVVRRAPLARVSETAHQVVREAQIVAVLGATPVPVPEITGIEESGAVLGAPFFVMPHLDGVVVRRAGLPASYAGQPDQHGRVGEQLVDTLALLHDVGWQGTPLADIGHPEGFLERQVERWTSQLDGYRCRDLPGVDRVGAWLDANRPVTGDLTVMHGDYKLDNVMLSPAPPPRVVSVMDFEMTTIGDPLIDLAWALIFWPEEGNLMALAAPGTPGGLDAEHCQTPGELTARYAERTGRSLDAFDWYQAFSAWKLAIVLEGSYAKYLSGESKNPLHELFGHLVEQLVRRAEQFAV